MPQFSEFTKLILFLVLGILVGIILCSASPVIFGITWKNEIGLDAIINLVAGAAIGIFLQQAYQKRNENLRIEKTLIIDQVKEAIKNLRDIRADFRSCYQNARLPKEVEGALLTGFRLLSNNLSYMKDFMSALDLNEEVISCDEFLSDLIDYKSTVTGGKDFPTIQYTKLEFDSGEQQFQKLSKALYTLLVEVNRS